VFISEALRPIMKPGRIAGRGDGSFQQSGAKTLACRRRNEGTTALLPFEVEGRFVRSDGNLPANRDATFFPTQRAMFYSIGSKLMHNEGEALRQSGSQMDLGTTHSYPIAKTAGDGANDVNEEGAASISFHQ
jgi:hypothetical protein